MTSRSFIGHSRLITSFLHEWVANIRSSKRPRLNVSLFNPPPLMLPSLAGRELCSDVFFHIVSFTDAFDVLSFSQCSNGSLRVAMTPAVLRSLIMRGAKELSARETEEVDICRSLLVASFLSRQSHELLLALLTMAARLGEDYRVNLFMCLQHASIASKFPREAAVYELASEWSMPRTFAAAWLNDIHELTALDEKRQLEPNAQHKFPNGKLLTPLCMATNELCLDLLLLRGADRNASILRKVGRSEPLLHQLVLWCNTTALRLVLAARGASRGDVNRQGMYPVLHKLLVGSPLNLQTVHCPPRCALRRFMAAQLRETLTILLAARADTTVEAPAGESSRKPLRASSVLVSEWPMIGVGMSGRDLVDMLQQLIVALRAKASAAVFDNELQSLKELVDQNAQALGPVAVDIRKKLDSARRGAAASTNSSACVIVIPKV